MTGAAPLPAPARDNYLAVVWRDERRPEEMCPQPSQPSPASPAQPSQPSLRTQFIVQKLNAGGIFFLQLCAAEQKGNKLKGSGKLFEWKFNNFLQLLAATSLLPVEARLPRRGNMLRYTLWVERPQCSSALVHYALVTALWVLSPLRVTHRQRGHCTAPREQEPWRRHCSFLSLCP